MLHTKDNSMADKYYVKWNDVDTFVNVLVDHIKMKKLKITGVFGLPRGGLIPAVMISHQLDIPLLLAPCNNCLIVDDIADSGKSLHHYTENDTQFNKYFIATMFYHERSIVKPDFYLYEKNDRWIVFPWEDQEC